ncbi:Ribosomal RNA-processing protein 1 [Thelohanellus kitauei]|uniref:Ribosomal RNA-processing protein 1 n=1 Tax=Thelohanellus kitauei TaxID=669202 RepID=A0A0C2IY07_THEKT|nr:Ribosomal RNA-processing protein 1 [Thelohanellus kitauei]
MTDRHLPPYWAKNFAHVDVKIRNGTAEEFKKWFSTLRDPIGELDMMKIWKGIFYAVWNCDKRPNQEILTSKIASFLEIAASTDNCAMFYRCFIRTFMREWGGVDRFRRDKFYLLFDKLNKTYFRLLHLKFQTQDFNKLYFAWYNQSFSNCKINDLPKELQMYFFQNFHQYLDNDISSNHEEYFIKIFQDVALIFFDPSINLNEISDALKSLLTKIRSKRGLECIDEFFDDFYTIRVQEGKINRHISKHFRNLNNHMKNRLMSLNA